MACRQCRRVVWWGLRLRTQACWSFGEKNKVRSQRRMFVLMRMFVVFDRGGSCADSNVRWSAGGKTEVRGSAGGQTQNVVH